VRRLACSAPGRPPTTSTRQARAVRGFVDGAAVVVARGLQAGGVGGREHAAAAVAGQLEAVRRTSFEIFGRPAACDLVAPGRDRADAARAQASMISGSGRSRRGSCGWWRC
jgi:hypothetical protein